MRQIIKSIQTSIKHPIFLAGLIVLAIRAMGILWHYLSKGVVAGPWNFIPVTLAYHFCVLLFITLALLLLQKPANPPRKLMLPFLLLAFSTIIFMGQTDFMMLRHTGQHFTPSIFRTYFNVNVFGPDLFSPLSTDYKNTLVNLGLVFGGWLLIGMVLLRNQGCSIKNTISWPFIALLSSISLLLIWPVSSDRPMQRNFVKPPELIFIEALGGSDQTPPPADEEKGMATLRKIIGLPPGWAWATPDYPLLRVPKVADSKPPLNDPEKLPDIIIWMVESLRAPDLGFLNSSGSQSLTPHMDRLAQKVWFFLILFPTGFLAARGFFLFMPQYGRIEKKCTRRNFPESVLTPFR